jgi:hypothetical protein
MKRLFLSLAVLCATTLFFNSQPALAQSTGKGKTEAKAGATEKKARPIPFYGKIKSIDPVARTLTVGSRVFVITPETRLMKRDKTPTTLAAGVAGLDVTGSYRKGEDGRLLANSIYFGPKTEAEKAASKGKRAD